MWPLSRGDAISHDSYLCQKYPDTQPFPTQRNIEHNNFFGAVVNDNWTLLDECPVECRPKDHPGVNVINLASSTLLLLINMLVRKSKRIVLYWSVFCSISGPVI